MRRRRGGQQQAGRVILRSSFGYAGVATGDGVALPAFTSLVRNSFSTNCDSMASPRLADPRPGSWTPLCSQGGGCLGSHLPPCHGAASIYSKFRRSLCPSEGWSPESPGENHAHRLSGSVRYYLNRPALTSAIPAAAARPRVSSPGNPRYLPNFPAFAENWAAACNHRAGASGHPSLMAPLSIRATPGRQLSHVLQPVAGVANRTLLPIPRLPVGFRRVVLR